MCYNCYEEHGSPEIVNKGTEKAAKLIAMVYEGAGAGGNAHIVVDDFNIKDRSIDWCLEVAIVENKFDTEPEQLAVERECLEAMKALTISERASALAIYEGWLEM